MLVEEVETRLLSLVRARTNTCPLYQETCFVCFFNERGSRPDLFTLTLVIGLSGSVVSLINNLVVAESGLIQTVRSVWTHQGSKNEGGGRSLKLWGKDVGTQTGRQSVSQTDRQVDSQSDRQAGRQSLSAHIDVLTPSPSHLLLIIPYVCDLASGVRPIK